MIVKCISYMWRSICMSAAVAVLAACGGGGGSDSGGGFVPAPEPEGATIDVALTDASGSSITEITPLNTGLFQVAVTTPGGEPLAQEVVSGDVTLGRLLPESGTALTNDDGVATFFVQPDGISGAGTMTATVTYNGVDTSQSLNYSVSTQLPFTLNAEFGDESGDLITRAVTGNRITLLVSLTDDRSGTSIKNQIVAAEIGDLGRISPASGTTVTDQSGEARFTIDVGNTPGVYSITVSVSVPGGNLTQSADIVIDQAIHQLGHFDVEGNFIEGVIGIVPDGRLSPGGTAILSFAVVDEDLNPVSTGDTLSVSSPCLFNNQALLAPTSPISIAAAGIGGLHPARLYRRRPDYSATGLLRCGSVWCHRHCTCGGARIVFDRADPELIALRGAGSASISPNFEREFSVTDADGKAVANARVNFELVQTVGGLALECEGSSFCLYDSAEAESQGRSSRDTTQSSVDGKAVTRVLAGTVASPVQVMAYVDLNNNAQRDLDEPTTTSKTLVVSTGLPDQNSVSLSASVLNVDSAYDVDGKTTRVSVRMADKFNNPAPDGTAVVFSTELGSTVAQYSGRALHRDLE